MCVLLKDHNAVMLVRLEPTAPQSRFKHSTTEPLPSLHCLLLLKSHIQQLRDFCLLSACQVLFHAFVGVCRLFSKLTYAKNYFRNPFSANQFGSRSGLTFCPDLGLNFLQRLPADDKIALCKEKFTEISTSNPF